MNADGPACTTMDANHQGQAFDWRGRLSKLVILCAGLIAYHNSFNAAFLLDDSTSIVENVSIRQFPPSFSILIHSPRPMLTLTLALSYRMGGLNTWYYHSVNVTIHLLAGLSLYGLARRTLLTAKFQGRFAQSASSLALVATLIWLVHPLQTQCVTYVVQRCEALMGLFFLLTLYCVVRGSESPWPRWWNAAAFVSCVLSMASKEVAVTLPLVVFLYDRIFLSASVREMVRRRWGLHGLLASIYAIPAAFWMFKVPVNAGFGLPGITPLKYAMTQPGVILHYLKLSFWPRSLCLDYSDWHLTTTFLRFLPPALGVLALVLASLWALRRIPGVGFLGLCFFLILAPTSSILPIADLAFEHRMYLSLAAVVLLTVLAGNALVNWLSEGRGAGENFKRSLKLGLAAVVVGILLFQTIRRNKDYASEVSMWSDVVAKRPENIRAHCTLGMAYWRWGWLQEAIAEETAALRLEPRHIQSVNALGLVLLQEGKNEEALVHFAKLTTVAPDFVFGHTNKGLTLFRLGKPKEAAESFRAAVKLSPGTPTYRFNLACSLHEQGQIEEAKEEYRQALQLNPDFPKAALQQAWRFATRPEPKPVDLAQALFLALQASQAADEPQPEMLDGLAVVYARLGRFVDAIATERKALEVATAAERPALTREIRQRLHLYEDQQPVIEEQP